MSLRQTNTIIISSAVAALAPPSQAVPEDAMGASLLTLEGYNVNHNALDITGEDLMRDMLAIENNLSFVNKSLESTGLDKSTAESLSLACESLTSRWGISSPDLAVEDYGYESSYSNTILAREGIKNSLLKMWDKLISWIGKVLRNAKGWIKSLLDSTKQMTTKLKALKDKVVNTNTIKVKDPIAWSEPAKAQLIKAVKLLSYSFNDEVAVDLQDAAEKQVEWLSDAEAITAQVEVELGVIASAIAGKDDVTAQIARGLKVEENYKFEKPEIAKRISNVIPKDALVQSAIELFGGGAVVQWIESKDGVRIPNISLIKPDVHNTGWDQKLYSSLTLPDNDDIITAIDAAVKSSETLGEWTKDFKKNNSKLDKLIKVLNEKKDEHRSTDNDDSTAILANARYAVRAHTVTQNAFSNSTKSYILGVINFVDILLKQNVAK